MASSLSLSQLKGNSSLFVGSLEQSLISKSIEREIAKKTLLESRKIAMEDSKGKIQKYKSQKEQQEKQLQEFEQYELYLRKLEQLKELEKRKETIQREQALTKQKMAEDLEKKAAKDQEDAQRRKELQKMTNKRCAEALEKEKREKVQENFEQVQLIERKNQIKIQEKLRAIELAKKQREKAAEALIDAAQREEILNYEAVNKNIKRQVVSKMTPSDFSTSSIHSNVMVMKASTAQEQKSALDAAQEEILKAQEERQAKLARQKELEKIQRERLKEKEKKAQTVQESKELEKKIEKAVKTASLAQVDQMAKSLRNAQPKGPLAEGTLKEKFEKDFGPKSNVQVGKVPQNERAARSVVMVERTRQRPNEKRNLSASRFGQSAPAQAQGKRRQSLSGEESHSVLVSSNKEEKSKAIDEKNKEEEEMEELRGPEEKQRKVQGNLLNIEAKVRRDLDEKESVGNLKGDEAPKENSKGNPEATQKEKLNENNETRGASKEKRVRFEEDNYYSAPVAKNEKTSSAKPFQSTKKREEKEEAFDSQKGEANQKYSNKVENLQHNINNISSYIEEQEAFLQQLEENRKRIRESMLEGEKELMKSLVATEKQSTIPKKQVRFTETDPGNQRKEIESHGRQNWRSLDQASEKPQNQERKVKNEALEPSGEPIGVENDLMNKFLGSPFDSSVKKSREDFLDSNQSKIQKSLPPARDSAFRISSHQEADGSGEEELDYSQSEPEADGARESSRNQQKGECLIVGFEDAPKNRATRTLADSFAHSKKQREELSAKRSGSKDQEEEEEAPVPAYVNTKSTRTKEEMLALRKNMMAYRAPGSKKPNQRDSSQEKPNEALYDEKGKKLPVELMNRLAKGDKVKVKTRETQE